MSLAGKKAALTKAVKGLEEKLTATTTQLDFIEDKTTEETLPYKEDLQLLLTTIETKSDNLDKALNNFEVEVDKIPPANEEATKDAETRIAEALDVREDAIDSLIRLRHQLNRISSLTTQQASREDSRTLPIQPNNIPAPNPPQQFGFREYLIENTRISKFKGNVWEFEAFWTQFEELIHKSEQPDLFKFNKLLNLLEGEPRELIARFKITGDNYNKAIALLKKRYNDQEQIVSQLTAQLKKETATSGHTTDQRKLFEKILITTNQLKDYQENVDTRMMKDEIVSKFAHRIQEDVYKKKLDSPGEWTLDKILEDLENVIIREESLNMLLKKEEKTKNMDNSTQKQQKSKDNKRDNKTPFRKNDDPCIFCKEKGHFFGHCPTKPNPMDRLQILKTEARCTRCTKTGHTPKDCKSKMCPVCNKDHHSSCCFEKHKEALPPKTFKKQDQKKSSSSSTTTAAMALQGDNTVCEMDNSDNKPDEIHTIASAKTRGTNRGFIPTIVTKAYNHSTGQWEGITVMLDSGSDQTFITRNLLNRWNLPNLGEVKVDANAFDSACQQKQFGRSRIQLRLKDTRIQMDVYVADSLVGHISKAPLTHRDMQFLLKEKLELNEDSLRTTSEPDMILGTDYWMEIVTGQLIQMPSGIGLIKTKDGFATMGSITSTDKSCHTNFEKDKVIVMALKSNPHDPERETEDEQMRDTLMKKPSEFSGSLKEEQSERDKKTIQFFEDTVEKRDEGYFVRIPYKEEHPPLPDNFSIALARLTQMRRQHSTENLQMIKDVFEDYKAKKFIEEVNVYEETPNKLHYNALQAVITPSKTTTKCRIVVDASAHYKDKPCLNDCIEQGPTILPDIQDMIIRFRSGQTVLISDVEKAFLQVFLHEDDRDVTRVLWFKDINKPVNEDNIIVYRFTRVLFGLNVSPFLLGQTIIHHLRSLKDDPIIREMPHNLYVDNSIITADENAENVIQIYKKVKKNFKDANMNLREFRSNCKTVNDGIAEEDKSKEEDMKVLGIWWTSSEDTITMDTTFDLALTNSRRTVSSDIASKFDPMGYLTPLLLLPKLFQRELWDTTQYGWATKLSEQHEDEYRKLIQDINGFTIKMPREIVLKTGKNSIITFCDASKEATACCVYVKNDKGTHIILGKSHVRPLKEKWTIPKLEMHALLLGTEKTIKVVKALQIGQTTIDQVVIMSDSTIALAWIKSLPTQKEVGTLIHNRLRDIVSLVDEMETMVTTVKFGHVRTHENPADLGTRGCTKEEFENSIWWKGPTFIQTDIHTWSPEHQLFQVERPGQIHTAALVSKESKPLLNSQATNSFQKMIRIALRVLKAAKIFSKPLGSERFSSVKDITLKDIANRVELKTAETLVIKDHQKGISYKTLQQYGNLGISPNKDNILVAKGRMELAGLEENARNPIFILPNSQLAKQIIADCHGSFHKTMEHTMDSVRRRFWIPKLRQQTKSFIARCIPCQRNSKQPCRYPDMGRIPRDRVNKQRPFGSTGLDNFGPIQYRKDDGTLANAYGTIFTCTTTRLIHVETVKNASALEFIQAFRKFVAIRGRPTKIVSDNGTNFVLGQKIIEEAFERSDCPPDMHKIDWKFITPYAPWKGGVYERMVKSVKEAFYKAVGRSKLTFEELTTVLYEATASINQRPLTKLEDDINAETPIRPCDFINQEMEIRLPLEGALDIKEDFRPATELQSKESMLNTVEALKSSIKASERVWKVWNSKYLAEMREGHKLRMDKKRGSPKPPKVGQLVLMCEELQPRNVWKMAKILRLNESSDGVVRDVDILTPNGRTLNRAINLIVPLELDEEDKEDETEHPSPQLDKPKEDPEKSSDNKKRYKLRSRKVVNYNEEEPVNNFVFSSGTKLDLILDMLVPERGGASSPIGNDSHSPRPYPDSPLIVSNVPSPDNYVEIVEEPIVHGSDNDSHQDTDNTLHHEPDNDAHHEPDNNVPNEPDNTPRAGKLQDQDDVHKRRRSSKRQNRKSDKEEKSTKRFKEDNRLRCVFCGHGHYSSDCQRYKTYEERVRRGGPNMCRKCLGIMGTNGHECRRRTKPCHHCRSPAHHTAFCKIQEKIRGPE
ncbi:hypothetical protein CRE_29148 [Caenorhabditis remanei]|uniref:Uncharacterized protein n=1 Tax=Caenorhabditis remanei TaxID=31234 RepID=E3N4L9_CAERE|nr:hypothetical protein CRE_29148 [Caenorhabditis remanei]